MLVETKEYRANLNKGEYSNSIISHIHSGHINNLNSNENMSFQVNGKVYCVETNTVLNFSKEFIDETSSLKYMKKMASKYPISEIIIIRKTQLEILIYI